MEVHHHAIDGLEHTSGEVVGVRSGHHVGRGQVEGDHADPAGRQLGVEALPIVGREAGEAVELLNQEDVPGPRIGQKAEQIEAAMGRATLVLDVPRGDRQAAVRRDGVELVSRPAGVLFSALSAKVRPNEHCGAIGSHRIIHKIPVCFEYLRRFN